MHAPRPSRPRIASMLRTSITRWWRARYNSFVNIKASAEFRAGDWANFELRQLVPALTEGVRNAASAVLEISQGLVPVDTGELKASGGTSVEWKGSAVNGYVTYSADHAAYNEFGTGQRGAASGNGAPGITYDPAWPGMTGSPFVRPALDLGRQQVLDAIKDALG